MAITSETLQNSIVQTIQEKGAEGGFLSSLGATPISYATDALKGITLGGSSTVLEGQKKPLTASGETSLNTIKAKQTIMLVATKEAGLTTAAALSLEKLTEQAVSRIVTDVDLAITLGRSRDTGALVPEFSSQSLVPNAQELLLPTPGDVSTLPAGLAGALSSSSALDAGILLSAPAYSSIAYSVNGSGVRMFPEANHREIFPFYGHDTKDSPSFGFNQTTANGKNALPNTNLALVGDYSNVYRAISNVTVDSNPYGIAGGINLFETNQIAYLIEVFYSFAVDSPEDFIILSSEADSGV